MDQKWFQFPVNLKGPQGQRALAGDPDRKMKGESCPQEPGRAAVTSAPRPAPKQPSRGARGGGGGHNCSARAAGRAPGPCSTPFSRAGISNWACPRYWGRWNQETPEDRTREPAGCSGRTPEPGPTLRGSADLGSPQPLCAPTLPACGRELGSRQQEAGPGRAVGPHAPRVRLPSRAPLPGRNRLSGLKPGTKDKASPLTQLLPVEIEVHTGDSISVSLKMPLQRGVLLGRPGPST